MPEAKIGCGDLFTTPRDDAALAARIYPPPIATTGTGKTVPQPTADGTVFSKR